MSFPQKVLQGFKVHSKGPERFCYGFYRGGPSAQSRRLLCFCSG